MKKPKPIKAAPMHGDIQCIDLLEVHPNRKRPPAKKKEPTIIGGRRGFRDMFVPVCSKSAIIEALIDDIGGTSNYDSDQKC